MTEVEKIALWAGLISSIVSIALSVVATVFAILVNHRSEKVSDQTIKSLQKIESTVERLSEDTSGLIKAAWDTMLGSVSGTMARGALGTSSAAHEIASGLASEVRSEIAVTGQGGDTVANLSKRIESALQKLQTSIEGQLKVQSRPNRPAAVFSKLEMLESLSPLAQELTRGLLSGGHLSQAQYNSLETGPLKKTISELREAGLLVPLKGHDDDQGNLVYWFSPGTSKNIRSALQLLPTVPASMKDVIKSELDKIDYKTS